MRQIRWDLVCIECTIPMVTFYLLALVQLVRVVITLMHHQGMKAGTCTIKNHHHLDHLYPQNLIQVIKQLHL